MKTIITIAAIILMTGCTCVTSEYKAFETAQEGIITGKGGTKVVVDEMEIWDEGEPPRKFKLLGFIDVNTNSARMHISSINTDVVKKARDAGGDAMIKLNSQMQLAEFYKAGGASFDVYSSYNYINAAAYNSSEKKVLKFAVIKYLK